MVQLTPKTVGDTHTTFTPPRFFPIFPFYLFKGKRRRYFIFFRQPYNAELNFNLFNVVTLAMWQAFFPLPQFPGWSCYTTVKRLFGANQNLDFLWFHPVLKKKVQSILTLPRGPARVPSTDAPGLEN